MLNQPTGIHHHVDVINQVGDIMIYYGSHSKIPTMIYDDSLIYIYMFIYLFISTMILFDIMDIGP